MTAYVYLPDDESDVVEFNSTNFVLMPETATPIKSRWRGITDLDVATFVAEKLSQWGARVVSGPVVNGKASNPEDQAAVDEADRVYLEATRGWAEGFLFERHKRNAPRVAIGLSEDKLTDDEKTAKDWLEAKAAKLAAL
jgi:hypothetical protein